MAEVPRIDDAWMVSMGPDLEVVERTIARATAGAVYQTYEPAPAGTGRPARYNRIVDYLEDRFNASLEPHQTGQPIGKWGEQWTAMIDYLEETPPFDKYIWPYRYFGLKKRMKRPPSPVDASARGRATEIVRR